MTGWSRPQRLAILVVGLVALVVAISWSSKKSEPLAGDTTCQEYNSGTSKTEIVNKMLRERKASVSPVQVDLTLVKVTAYCYLHEGTSKIKGIYG